MDLIVDMRVPPLDGYLGALGIEASRGTRFGPLQEKVYIFVHERNCRITETTRTTPGPISVLSRAALPRLRTEGSDLKRNVIGIALLRHHTGRRETEKLMKILKAESRLKR